MELPNPEPGLVVSYSYLWRDEYEAGQEEGRKDRPSVVVLALERANDGMLVTVLPITQSPPNDPDAAVEIPPRIKRHLGLDDERSRIVVSEGNDFLWPGYDLRKRPGADRCDYGILPGRMFEKMVEAFLKWTGDGRARRTPRD